MAPAAYNLGMAPPSQSVIYRTATTQRQAVQVVFAIAQAQQEQQAIDFMQWSAATRARQHTALFNLTHLKAVLLTPAFKSLLGVQSSVDVALFASSGQHARVSHTKDAPEILLALPKTLNDLAYVGRDSSSRGIFQLVFRHKGESWLFVPIKFIPAGERAKSDECWVATAFKINRERLNVLTRRYQLGPA
jgi:hypothetical protein